MNESINDYQSMIVSQSSNLNISMKKLYHPVLLEAFFSNHSWHIFPLCWYSLNVRTYIDSALVSFLDNLHDVYDCMLSYTFIYTATLIL